jgi:hypothetical protein
MCVCDSVDEKEKEEKRCYVPAQQTFDLGTMNDGTITFFSFMAIPSYALHALLQPNFNELLQILKGCVACWLPPSIMDCYLDVQMGVFGGCVVCLGAMEKTL